MTARLVSGEPHCTFFLRKMMVAPVTGPFNKVLRLPLPPFPNGEVRYGLLSQKQWYRQRKPYNLPLEYYLSRQVVTKDARSPTGWVPWSIDQNTAPGYDEAHMAYASNKAYAKFIDEMGSPSQWAVNLAEFGQTVSLVVDSARTLTKFARYLHRFDFVSAATMLRTGLPKGLKAKADSFANNWLKFHFGWEPLVQDIGAAIETLQRPYPSKEVVAKGVQKGTSWTDRSPVLYGFDYTRESRCRIQAKLSLENENLYLANQLGFTNPLSVAWNLVPFSFIVDWFANVNQCLNSFSDFIGIQISETMTTYFQKTVCNAYDLGYVSDWAGSSWTVLELTHKRDRTFPKPILTIRPLKTVSPVRGATAIALLIQQMKR